MWLKARAIDKILIGLCVTMAGFCSNSYIIMVLRTYIYKFMMWLTVFLAGIRGFAAGLFLSVYLYTPGVRSCDVIDGIT